MTGNRDHECVGLRTEEYGVVLLVPVPRGPGASGTSGCPGCLDPLTYGRGEE